VEGPDPELSVSRVQAVLSLGALLAGRIELARLEFAGARLRVERVDTQRWVVGGQLIDTGRMGIHGGTWAGLLAVNELAVRGLRIDWSDRLASIDQSIEGLELLAARGANRLQLAVNLPSVGALARSIEIRVDAGLAEGASPSDLRNWRGEWHVRVDELDIAMLARQAGGMLQREGLPLGLRSGRGSAMIWSEFGDGEWRDLLFKGQADALDLRMEGRTVPLRALTLEARARRGLGSLVELQLDQFRAVDGSGLVLETDDRPQRLVLDSDQFAPTEIALSFRGMDAGPLLAAAQRLPVADSLVRSLAGWRASGRVESLGFSWRAGSERDDILARFDLKGFGLRRAGPAGRGTDAQSLPSITNLTGRVELDRIGGRAWIDSRQLVLTFPGVFAQPVINVASLTGELDWVVNAPQADKADEFPTVDVRVDMLRFANADLAGQLAGRYRFNGAGPGVADLRGSLSRANAARIARYLPERLPAGVRTWVARSVGSGQSNQARWVLRGDVRHFPFRDPAQGEFLVEAQVSGVRLGYAPDWPEINGVEARLRFERAGMWVEAQRARLFDVALANVRARIEDFRLPDLMIEGEANGSAESMLKFLAESPLRHRVDPAVLELDLTGRAHLDLALTLPLAGAAAPRYRGGVDLADGKLALGPDVPLLSALAAKLAFSDEGLNVPRIRAELLGGVAEASARLGRDGRLKIEAQGRADSSELQRWLLGEGVELIQGEGTYRLSVETAVSELNVKIDSDLIGISSRLPAPLAKSADEVWPLQVDWRRSRTPAARATDRAEQLRARLRGEFLFETERRFDAQTGRFELTRGSLSAGSRAERLARGFAAAVHLPHFDVEAWRPVAAWLQARQSSALAGGSAVRAMPALDRVKLSADTVDWSGRVFRRLEAQADREAQHWTVLVSAEQGEGRIEWYPPDRPDEGGTLVGRFSRLEIPSSVNGPERGSASSEPSEVKLPALEIEAERLVLAGRTLGSLRLAAVNTGSGPDAYWRLDRLALRHPGGQLAASGTWRPSTRPPAGLGASQGPKGSAPVALAGGGATLTGTQLDFKLDLTEPGQILSTFGIQGALAGGAGSLAGRIGWDGSPLALHYPSMTGSVDIELKRGQFLKTDPGIAKLIGVLNLQSLPRRLSLDFRDLIAEGFSFDEIKGVARLEAGVARTDAFAMRGVQALIDIRGEANLAEETQHLNIRVRPEMNAGLASLAYAAMANPAVGLGTFLAQLALRKPIRDIFTYEYEVRGSWTDPSVIERARPRVELQSP
jgi:uncharacterized protein (TIGR02099 family)